jgi:hypothetical protein
MKGITNMKQKLNPTVNPLLKARKMEVAKFLFLNYKSSDKTMNQIIDLIGLKKATRLQKALSELSNEPKEVQLKFRMMTVENMVLMTNALEKQGYVYDPSLGEYTRSEIRG